MGFFFMYKSHIKIKAYQLIHITQTLKGYNQVEPMSIIIS